MAHPPLAATAANADAPSSPWRWVLAIMLFLLAVLNYVDRQTLSIVATTLQKDLAIDELGYAYIQSAFQIAYTVSLLISGYLVDRFGARMVIAVALGWWSLAGVATAYVGSFEGVLLCRALLGFGEAALWPAAARLVGERYPASERAIITGLYTMGATIGATIAPLLVLHLENYGGWGLAFEATGLAGLVVLPFWYIFSQRGAPAARPASVATASAGAWRSALGLRDLWPLLGARLLTDPVWFFYLAWLQKFMLSAGIPKEQHSHAGWVFLAADAGCLLGGLYSAWRIRRGASPPAARMGMLLIAACCMPISLFMPTAHASLPLLLAPAMVMCFAHMCWQANITALIIDRVPTRLVGTAFGIIACGSATGGIAMNMLVAWLLPTIKDGVVTHPGHGGYAMWFVIMAFLHPVAWLLLRSLGLHRPIPPST